jgi:hypothetical protein
MKIVHIWYGTYSKPDPERDRRNALAQESWVKEYANPAAQWVARQVTPDDLPRTSLDIGDPQQMPYVHDLIDAGLGGRTDCAVFLTNADVGFVGGITDRILSAAREHRCAHMRRKEIGLGATVAPTDQQVMEAPEYCGMDGTVFTASWWAENRGLCPPMVWGAFGWDSAFRNLIRWKGGPHLANAIWHSEHGSTGWNQSIDWVYKGPANHHNRMLLWRWILDHGGSEADHLYADGELTYR